MFCCQDPKEPTIYVPSEESLFQYTILEQSVAVELRELEFKNPTLKTIDEMVDRITDGTPGSELDDSLLKIDKGSDSVLFSLTGGKSLMEKPKGMLEAEPFSFQDYAVKEVALQVEGGTHTHCGTGGEQGEDYDVQKGFLAHGSPSTFYWGAHKGRFPHVSCQSRQTYAAIRLVPSCCVSISQNHTEKIRENNRMSSRFRGFSVHAKNPSSPQSPPVPLQSPSVALKSPASPSQVPFKSPSSPSKSPSSPLQVLCNLPLQPP